MNTEFNSLDLIAFYYRNYKYVAVITLAAAIISLLVAFLIPPEYKSGAILFPASNTSVSKELLTDLTRSRKDILQFGEDVEAEQILQILHSDVIKNRIIQNNNLFEHYKIDQNSDFPQTAIGRLFEKNIKFSRTQYQSIEIEVLDRDPNMAAQIASNIIELLDTVYNNIQKKRALEAYQIVKKEYSRLLENGKGLQDSLSLLRAVGIFDYATQSQAYTEALARAIESNNKRAQEEIAKKLATFQQFGGLFLELNNKLIANQEQLALISSKLTEARVDYEQNLSHIFVVNPPYVPEKKSKPMRWLIVSLSTLSGFLFASILLLIIERLKKIDFKKIIEKENEK